MAWIRQLPSGLWAATVRTPNGRVTKTDRLKGVVADWAAEQEGDVRHGDWIDPRDGEHTVGECRERWGNARRLQKASVKRDESHWRCHVQERWADIPIGGILLPDVNSWITDMVAAGVGAATIEGAVGVLRSILDQAVAAKWLRHNPARGAKPPRRNAHHDRILAQDEDELLLSAVDRIVGDRPDGRLAFELMLYCGLRWEEMGALDRAHVDTRRRLLHIGPVLERDGTIRPFPKTPAGVREVPVDEDLWPHVRDRVLAIPRDGLLVTSPEGGTLDYSRWYARVWRLSIDGRPAYAGAQGHSPRAAIAGAGLDDPQPTPHDLRHAYGTRLGEQGVVGHELMALMGHESLAAVQRYLHAGDGRHDRARAAVKAARRPSVAPVAFEA